MAPARWCVYEWTEYRLTVDGADRLKVGSTWVYPKFESRFVVRFENQLGLTSIRPFSGGAALGPALHLEVLARKFAHPQQSVDFMMAILSDIFARQSSLPFEAVAMTERRVRESHRPPDLLFTYHFFRHHSHDLVRALQAILGRPHQRLSNEGVMVRLHEVRTLESEAILRLLTSGRGAGGSGPGSGHATLLQRLQPERVFQRMPEETFDTPENRFVVMVARRMSQALDHLLHSTWFRKIGIDGRDQVALSGQRTPEDVGDGCPVRIIAPDAGLSRPVARVAAPGRLPGTRTTLECLPARQSTDLRAPPACDRPAKCR